MNNEEWVAKQEKEGLISIISTPMGRVVTHQSEDLIKKPRDKTRPLPLFEFTFYGAHLAEGLVTPCCPQDLIDRVCDAVQEMARKTGRPAQGKGLSDGRVVAYPFRNKVSGVQ